MSGSTRGEINFKLSRCGGRMKREVIFFFSFLWVGQKGGNWLFIPFFVGKKYAQMVNFPTRIPDCDSHRPALLDLFISFDASICSAMAFPPFGNSDHVVVSVSIEFPINLKRDAPFHRKAYDYSRADWDGLRYHLRDAPWEDNFKLSASTAANEFYEWVQVGIHAGLSLRNMIGSNKKLV